MSTKLQRIDDVDRVEVGRMYWVPCTHAVWLAHSLNLRWWPVMGNYHEDEKYIGFDAWHYHADPRFLSDQEVRRVGGWWNVFARPIHDDEEHPTAQQPSPIEYRRRKCQRKMPIHPATLGERLAFPKLNQAFKGKRLIDGRCPHKGFDLRSMPVRDDGCIECPLHGLRWNAVTGECVS